MDYMFNDPSMLDHLDYLFKSDNARKLLFYYQVRNNNQKVIFYEFHLIFTFFNVKMSFSFSSVNDRVLKMYTVQCMHMHRVQCTTHHCKIKKILYIRWDY